MLKFVTKKKIFNTYTNNLCCKKLFLSTQIRFTKSDKNRETDKWKSDRALEKM